MQVDGQAQAIMLLTVAFGKSVHAEAKPLSGKEWGKFAGWLKERELQPSFLLEGNLGEILTDWKGMDPAITLDRLDQLLGRGGALALALEKWQRAGLWVLTRSDPDYPGRLKQRLKAQSPPVLFGCGNRRLLNQGGVAVVGSRNATEGDLGITSELGAEIASRGQSVVSGGARGVDQHAMLGALEREGTAVGVLADRLLRVATSAIYRKYLTAHNLVLVSPFNPEAGFHVGNAMARNRYIYCLADRAVVISSSLDKGGTWHGAVEAMQAQWVPLWVMAADRESSGNPELVRRGAKPWEPGDFGQLFGIQTAAPAASQETAREKGAVPSAARAAETGRQVFVGMSSPTDEFYEFFLRRLNALTSGDALTPDDISNRLNLKKPQVNAWLGQGVREKRIRKLNRPVRYRVESQQTGQQQLDLPVEISPAQR